MPWTFPAGGKSTQTESWGTQNTCPGSGQAQGHLQSWRRDGQLSHGISRGSEQSLPLHPLLRQGGHGGACDLTPALNTDPPNSKVTIQVRLEETDQRTDPASLHPTDPGNQDRKRKGSLTGLTGLNKHPGFSCREPD